MMFAQLVAAQERQPTQAEKDRTVKVWDALMTEIAPYRESLASCSVEFDPNRFYAQNRVMPSTAEEFKKFLDDLSAIEKLIQTEKYKGLVGFFGPSDDIIHRPQYWEEVVKDRNAICQRMLTRELPRILMPHTLPLKSMIRSVEENDGWGLSEAGLSIVTGNRAVVRQKVFDKVKGLAAVVGLKLDENAAPEWEKLCDRLTEVSFKKAKTAKPAATYSMPAVAEALKKRWSSGPWASRKITKINTESNTWKITRNAIGTPLYRTVSVVVRFELAGFADAIEYSTQIKEDYVGSGKYAFVTSNFAPDYRLVAR